MGKSARKKAKKGKIDFDSLFDSTKPQSEGNGAWHSGVSAMALEDDDEYGAPARPAAAAAIAPAAAQARADAMDTADYMPLAGSSQQKPKGLKVQQQSVKIQKRGNRSASQKQRRAAKQEKVMRGIPGTVCISATQVARDWLQSSQAVVPSRGSSHFCCPAVHCTGRFQHARV